VACAIWIRLPQDLGATVNDHPDGIVKRQVGLGNAAGLSDSG
jgi:hypothetical protein